MNPDFTKTTATAHRGSAMEAETMKKNAARLKSHTSKGNLKKLFLLLACCLSAASAMAVDWPANYRTDGGIWFNPVLYLEDVNGIRPATKTAIAEWKPDFTLPQNEAEFDIAYAALNVEYPIENLRPGEYPVSGTSAYKVAYAADAIYVLVQNTTAYSSVYPAEVIVSPYDKLENAPEEGPAWIRYAELGGYSAAATNGYGKAIFSCVNDASSGIMPMTGGAALNYIIDRVITDVCSDDGVTKVAFQLDFSSMDDTLNGVDFDLDAWKSACGGKGIPFDVHCWREESRYAWNSPEANNYFSNFYVGYLKPGEKGDIAQGTTGDLTWVLDCDNTLTISGDGEMENYYMGDWGENAPWCNLYIRKVVIEYGVKSIGDCAFLIANPDALTSVSIPGSVISIGDYAFYGCCGLTSIIIPDGVESIGTQAFQAIYRLTSITIPGSVTSIGDGLFRQCDALLSIDVDSANPSFSSEDGVLFNKEKTVLFECPKAKGSCNIPSSVTDIAYFAFVYCWALTSIDVDSANPVYSSEDGVLFNKEKTTLICCPIGKSGSYTIPNGVKNFNEYAFDNCQNLTSVTIPSSVENIELGVFANCISLTSVTIMGNNMKSIGQVAFGACSGLSSITIPSGVESIGFQAFGGCEALTSVTNMSATPQEIEFLGVFDGVDLSAATLYVPLGSKATYEAAPVWQDFGSIVEIVIGGNYYIPNTSSYPNTMTYTAVVALDGVELQSNLLEIGAFSGSECRGSALLQHYPESPAHPYLGFLVVYGDENEPTTLRVYNHETGKEYTAGNAPVTFVADAIYGNPATPYVVTISDTRTQTIPLNEGWSWISVNVENSTPALLNQFKGNIGSVGVMLKSRDAFIQTPGWIGTLQEMNNTEMYMVNTTATHSLSFTGYPASAQMVLQGGWNWIGYVPQQALPLSAALAELNPQEGDQVKSRTEFSIYTGGEWIGSLESMFPGEGYKYYSASETEQAFVYPSAAFSSQAKSAIYTNRKWIPDGRRFADNMTLTSIVKLDNEEWQNKELEIGAFVGKECRGSVRLKSYPQISEYPIAFLVIYGEPGDAMQLRVYDHETGEEYAADNDPVIFATDAIAGAPFDPFQIETSTIKINGTVAGTLSLSPNPVTDYFHIGGIEEDTPITLSEVSGRVVLQTVVAPNEAVSVTHLPQGVYILQVAGKAVKMIKQGD